VSWRRVLRILLFDLRHGALRPRGLLFVVPFLLLWYPILRGFDPDVAAWFRGRDALVLTATLFDAAVARSLFLEHPPLLSACFLVALSSAPFFCILAGYDQFASDLGNGFMRLIVTRATRLEIFVGRYLSGLVLVTAAFWTIVLLAAVLSLFTEPRPAADVLLYAVQIMLTLLLYLAPLIAFMSLVSALSGTAIGALFFGLAAYAGALVTIWIGNGIVDGVPFAWLLPSGVKPYLFGIDPVRSSLAAAVLPVYVLCYGWLGWRVFRARNF
jgi:hypothetical protein